MDEERTWRDGEAFHAGAEPVYDGASDVAHLFKEGRHMAHVRYRPSHPNPDETGPRAGAGANDCVWVACEQGAQAEGISVSCLDALIDSRLEPHAAVGWHLHERTEEVYYLLEGLLTVEVEDADGRPHRRTLLPGDSHRVGPGMRHGSVAGEAGARFLCVLLRAPHPGTVR